jgi:hypothetical protein
MIRDAKLDGTDGTKVMPTVASNLPAVPEPADVADVLHEQLDYLIDHASERGTCGCSECQRYLRVRSALLEIFGEPEPQQVRQHTAAISIAA